jgi:acetyl esterase/lipase
LLRHNKIEAPDVSEEQVPAVGAQGTVANRAEAVLNPSPDGTPVAPADTAATWTLFAFVRRELAAAAAKQSPTVDPLAGQSTSGLADDTTALAQSAITWPPPDFTGKPSFLSNAVSATFRLVGNVGTALHVDLTIPATRLLASARPPRWTTAGLTVQRNEFEGMPVWTLQVSDPSGKEVVGVHGGGVIQPVIFNWLEYATIARDTGATVIVPIYPLVGRGGTAATIVPAIADLISAQIDQHGAGNVSVFGDSAGGEMLLSAMEEIVRRGDPVPSHMVLSSPVVDGSFTNPAIPLVDDPVFRGPALSDLHRISQRYADGLDPADSLVSPLYGSLAGLPPTTVYAGSNEIVAPDILLLRDKAAATPGADFTFVLRKGEPHDWAIFTIFPETKEILSDIYEQLGIAPGW